MIQLLATVGFELLGRSLKSRGSTPSQSSRRLLGFLLAWSRFEGGPTAVYIRSLLSFAASSLVHQRCDCHEIIGKYGGADPQLKPFTSAGQTTLHASTAE